MNISKTSIVRGLAAAIAISALPVATLAATTNAPAVNTALVNGQRGTVVTTDFVRQNGTNQTVAATAVERPNLAVSAGVPHNAGNLAGEPQENNSVTGLGQ